MRRLFAYILKHNFTILFLLLEVFAFMFLIQNDYQGSILINTSGKLTGSVFNSYNNITHYLSLKKANEILSEENTRLRQQLEESFRMIDTNTFYTKDTAYRYIHSRVINNTIGKQKNYLILNKGLKHGIQKDMGVISSGGVVGTVVEVSQNFARVMSVLHIRNKINARIKKNRHLGNLEWNGKDYKFGLLTDIPSHVELLKGDSIITSGNSNIFPEGISIGIVEEYYNNAGNKFNTAVINFTVDFNNLYDVYVILNLDKSELDQIKTMAE
ncbi:MAG: rod shape-determining protein MreC [Bacteroidales bacterium]|nr:rod shape-determining protein MreC [Bacteroidales bacterium]